LSATTLATKSSTIWEIPSRPPSCLYTEGGGAGGDDAHPVEPTSVATRITTPPHPIAPRTMSVLLGQPAFTALVVLHVTVRLASADLGQPEVELLDVGVVPQRRRRALQHDPAVLHHVAVVGDGQRQGRVLLHEQHRELLLPVEPLHDGED